MMLYFKNNNFSSVLVVLITSLVWLLMINSISAEGYQGQKDKIAGGSSVPDTMNINLTSDEIGATIRKLSSEGDKEGLKAMTGALKRRIVPGLPENKINSELFYYLGVCYILTDQYNTALLWFKRSIDSREALKLVDDHYANSIYNLGVVHNFFGDYSRVCDIMLDYIRIGSEMYGPYSPQVATAYSTLIGAALECKDYENFIKYTFTALEIISKNETAWDKNSLADLYNSIGAGYARMADFTKAIIYFKKAESIYQENNLRGTHNYINLINSLAITYSNLGDEAKGKEYFEKGIELAVSDNSFLTFNLLNSYAIEMGNSGKIEKGEELLYGLLEKAEELYGTDSRYYINVLCNYAEFIRDYKNDFQNSISHFLICIDYLNRHEEEILLRDPVYIGYSLALSRDGESEEALRIIHNLLISGIDQDPGSENYNNPDASLLKADNRTLRVLKTKYEILWDIYKSSGSEPVLEAAASTSELIITLIDKIRLSISEDESRIILGDRYKDSYLNVMRDFELCYRNTGDKKYLAKAFEYAERSKVAGLLASTRELNAVQLHVPIEVAEFEKSLQRKIGLCNSRIYHENLNPAPNRALLEDWNRILLKNIKSRDSLLMIFERDYPDYYAIKYNNSVPSMEDVPSIAGRNTNYLNYVVADSVIYIFIINRKHHQMLTVNIDGHFIEEIKAFISLLSAPSESGNARSQFNDYQEIGYSLYSILVEPVRKYFISDNLLISPDNILSYIPFETLITSHYSGNDLLYRKLQYLMNDYNISYAYSVTLMKEIVERKRIDRQNLVAFAPVYPNPVYLDSILLNRKDEGGILYDLPYARQEAEYVSGITGGALFLNDKASESAFKSHAGNYEIIHLAMHTFLNDQYPMNSAMIFSQPDDKQEDGLLHTFEVYGMPLNARMVVLSSCNTGTGKLSSGEGILSLARGFLYSGSRSVVMAMWNIEDKSGTDIMKVFYSNLLKGMSKSKALMRARTEYLKKASQLKSHPYFWSTLVIYGENSPLFIPVKVIFTISGIILVILILVIYYFKKRKYS